MRDRSSSLRVVTASIACAAMVGACGSASTTTSAAVTTTISVSTTGQAAPADPDRQVVEGDVISVHYVGTLDDGEQFDSSRDRDTPLSFTVGSGQMIAGFDQAVRGMKVGEIKDVRIDVADAYGERDESLMIEVGIDQVPEGVVVGDQLTNSQGQTVTVADIEGDVVLIDANHPLAGEALNFEIELLTIGE